MTTEKFKNIVLKTSNKLYTFAYRMLHDSEEAKDVVQETMIKLWDKKKTLGKIKNIDGFAMTITKNICLDKLRKQQRNRTISIDNAYYLTEKKNLEMIKETKDSADFVLKLINALPENQKIVMHLREVEEYEYEDIAEITGMTVNTVRVNISRARKKIREELNKIYSYGIA